MLTGQEAPDAGTVKIGDTVELAYVDQSRDVLDADTTVYEEITGGVDHMKVGNREIHGRAYVASFNFKGSDQQKRVGDLSGGERNRVHLAKLLQDRRQRAAARRADERPRRRHACAPSRTRSTPSPAARSSSATTAGSSTASPPTCSRSRATARCAGSRATSPSTRRSGTRSSAPTPTRPTASSTSPSLADDAARRCRLVVVVICVGGIVGMIVASVAGNNNGVVVTFGLVTAVSILVLMAFATANRSQAAGEAATDDALAATVEQRIVDLVATGVSERALRDLVRDAVRLGRGTRS